MSRQISEVRSFLRWSSTGTYPDGPAFTVFLPALNSGAGFTGHTDWRLPTISELQTILLAPYPCGTTPCIDPIFGPTYYPYWSSSADRLWEAWYVDFGNVGYNGYVGIYTKSTLLFVRAVRTLP